MQIALNKKSFIAIYLSVLRPIFVMSQANMSSGSIDAVIAACWTEKVRLNRNDNCWKPTKNTKICSLHFNDKDKYVTKGGLCRLHHGVVPSKNLPIFVMEEKLNINVLCDVILHTEPNQPQPGTSGGDTSNKSDLHTPTSSISSSIFDTPKKASLRRKLNKKILLQQKHSRKIKTLSQMTRRLKEKNASLKNILIYLRKKRFINKLRDKDKFSVAYVTVPSTDVGKTIAHGLVKNKLAACVNIIPQITSVYEWKNEINEDSEALLMIKTRTTEVDNLTEFVRKNHPYEVCEVISLPIKNGNPPYLKWIGDIVPETKVKKN